MEVEIIVDGFYVFEDDWPEQSRLSSGYYGGLIITGARKFVRPVVILCLHIAYSANDTSPPFIPKLVSLVQSLTSDSAYSSLKIMGYCFGHQVIAVACGGKVVEGGRGSELGVYPAGVTPEGQDFFATTPGQVGVKAVVSLQDSWTADSS